MQLFGPLSRTRITEAAKSTYCFKQRQEIRDVYDEDRRPEPRILPALWGLMLSFLCRTRLRVGNDAVGGLVGVRLLHAFELQKLG